MQLTTSFQKVAEKKLGNNGYGDVYIRLYAKYNSQSIANNTSNVTLEARIRTYGGYWWSDTGTSYRITGSGSIDTKAISKNGKYEVGETVLGSVTKDIGHDSSGNLTMTGSANFKADPWGWNQTATASDMTLPTIPRYANITSFSVSKRDETSVSVGYTADATCDWAKYSLDNVNWYDLPNSGIISELSANTTYNFYLGLRRKDSQLWSYAGPVQQTTYDYPHCTSLPNFTIGNNVKIDFYNPLNRTFQIQMWSYANGQFVSDLITVSGTSYTGFSNVANRLYQSIPNARESQYNIDAHYAGNKAVGVGGKYSINVNNSKPIFNDFDYSTNLSELTGNNNTIINGKTTTSVIISTSKKAQGYQGATITKYRIECGNKRAEVNYSENEIVQQFGSCTSPTLKITAIDSRGLETTVSKTVTNFKNYVAPSFGANSTERKNGVDTESYLSASLNFWNGNFGAGDNKITSFGYRTKKRTESNYSSWFDIDLENIEIYNDEANLYDYMIHANGSSGGFEIGIAYDIQLVVSDGLDTYVLTTVTSTAITLTDGKVGFSLLKDENGDYHVGIDCMPDLKAPIAIKNKIPLVKVSSEEPDTGEELWIQKSKNLFKFNSLVFITRWGTSYTIDDENNTMSILAEENDKNRFCSFTFDYKLLLGKTVTMSANIFSNNGAGQIVLWWGNNSTPTAEFFTALYNVEKKSITFSVPEELPNGMTQLNMMFYGNGVSGETTTFSNIQIEVGDIATDYEPYIDKKIYTKNENGEYVELSNFEKNIITAKRSSNMTFTTTTDWSNTEIPMEIVSAKVGNKLTMENGRIKIGKGVSHIKLNGNFQADRINGTGTIGLWLGVFRNGEFVAPGGIVNYSQPITGGLQSISVSPVITSVQENDEIIFSIYIDNNGGSMRIRGGYEGATSMTVEVVE